MPVLGVRAHDLAPRDAEGLGRAAASLGFALLQLAPAKSLADCPPPPEPMSLEWAAGVRLALLKSGVGVAVLGCYVDVCGPDPRSRGDAMKRLSHNLALAPSFGASLVATETPLSGGEPRECSRALREALGRLLPEAEAAGVALCVEPVHGHAVPSPAAMRELAEDMGSRALGVVLDPVNLVDPSSRAEPWAPALEAIDILGPSIMAVHVKDYSMADGDKRGSRVGAGLMDWRRLVPAVAAAAPRAPFIVEGQDAEGMAAALALLRPLLGGG